jgi:uncharacterized Zn-binding protein involved in type VI secretion
MQPVARKGDMVFFPKCLLGPNKWPIFTGSGKFTEIGKPVARVTDKVNCPLAKPIIMTGSGTFSEDGQPVAVVGDEALCPKCGKGYIVEGSPKFTET